MSTTRRGFFKLVAGAAALAAVPAAAITKPLPMIYCDGVNDDGPGLTALMSGDAVEFLQPEMEKYIGWSGDILMLSGYFTIKTTVKAPPSFSEKCIIGGMFQTYCMGFDFTEAPFCRLEYVTINSKCEEPVITVRAVDGSGVVTIG